MNLETVLLIMAVVAVVLINNVLPWVKKSLEDIAAGNANSELPEAPIAAEPWASSASESELFGNAAIGRTTPMALVGSRPARRLALGSLSDIRDAIIVAEVLGPCRAQKPLE